MNIAVVLVASNAYSVLGMRFVSQFRHHYRGNAKIAFHWFSDTDPAPYLDDGIAFYRVHHADWLAADHDKIRSVGLVASKLDADSYVYYFDADTAIHRDFTDDWFLGDLVAGVHFCNSHRKPFDRNPDSQCCVPDSEPGQTYVLGAFFGGRAPLVSAMCVDLVAREDADLKRGYEAAVNDESYLNYYFHFHKPTKLVLTNQFEFVHSHKGGLQIERRPDYNVDSMKTAIRENRGKPFDIRNGQIVFGLP